MPRNKIARVLVIGSTDFNHFVVVNGELKAQLKPGKSAIDLGVLPKASYEFWEVAGSDGELYQHTFKGGVRVKPEKGFYVVIVVLSNGTEMWIGTPDLPVYVDCKQRFSDFHSVELDFSWKYDTLLRIG